MSDNMALFRGELRAITVEELQWLDEYWVPPDDSPVDPVAATAVQDGRWRLFQAEDCTCEADDPDDELTPFCWDVGVDEEGDMCIVMSPNEGDCNPEVIGYCVQKFLERFRPTEVFTMTWAVFQTPIRETGHGGALVVNAKKVLFKFTGDVERDLRTRLEPSEVWIVWGSGSSVRELGEDAVHHYSFETPEELNAFLTAVNDADGWLDSYQCDTEEEANEYVAEIVGNKDEEGESDAEEGYDEAAG